MAENKKSFILYCDLIENIDHLTNEEKGILFQHLLDYVNDKNPVDFEDRVLLSVWKPIKKQLQRDLDKFKEVKLKRSESGRLGGISKAKKSLSNLASAKSAKQSVANVADNDNVNDNVNDIHNTLRDLCLEFHYQNPDKYKPEFYTEFIEYWTAPIQNGKNKGKELWKCEKTWDLKRRLKTSFDVVWSNKHKNQSTINQGRDGLLLN